MKRTRTGRLASRLLLVLAPLLALAARPAAAQQRAAVVAPDSDAAPPVQTVLAGTGEFGLIPSAASVLLPAAAAAANPAASPFLLSQLDFPRVRVARVAADGALRAAFAKAGLPYPASRIFLRAFKRERELEVWAERADHSYALAATYPICTLGGSILGPKRRQGDEQVPEGFYQIVDFNPQSEYHLSLRLDYPNVADRVRLHDASLGGDIFIHGGCQSAGCLPLTDQVIEQVYWLAAQARAAGERAIPIHIFPARLTDANLTQLRGAFAARPDITAFWQNLKEGFDAFERTHRVPEIGVGSDGRYVVRDEPDVAASSRSTQE